MDARREPERRERYQEQALIEALQALDDDRPAGDHPAVVHARRHRRRHRLQQGRVPRHRRARHRRLAHQRGADRGIACSAGKNSRWRWCATRTDNCIIICSIENLDPMGVHTGDSITIAPALTLTDKEYQIMRDASIAVLREIGVETGGSNVQFAVNPADGRLVVIEMNPRVSRSSALASKATGFPIAKVAAKLAVGYTLDEIANDITGGATPASFEPTIDYVVTKIPRFAFEKFPGAAHHADHLDEVGRRGDGDRPHLPGEPAEGAALARNRPHRPRRDRRSRGSARATTRTRSAPRSARRRPTGCCRSRRRCGSASPTRRSSRPARSIPGSSRRSAASSRRKPRSARKGLPANAGGLRRLKAMGFSDARLAGARRNARKPTSPRRGARSACGRCSSASTPARPSSPRPPPTCIRPTRRRSRAPSPTRRSRPTRRRSSSSAAGRTASARASSSTIAAATPASRCRKPATKPS